MQTDGGLSLNPKPRSADNVDALTRTGDKSRARGVRTPEGPWVPGVNPGHPPGQDRGDAAAAGSPFRIAPKSCEPVLLDSAPVSSASTAMPSPCPNAHRCRVPPE